MKLTISKKYLILTVLFISTFFVNAQDTIVKINKDTILCKIKEITTDDVKYKDLSVSNEVVFSVDKNEIRKVILSNGKVLFSSSKDRKINYANQNKNCFKFRLLSPLFGYTDLIYERSLKPRRSIECALGLIGLGKQWDKTRGVSLRFGYKLITTPDFYLKGMKYAHILKGTYVRPELATSFYKESGESKDFFAMALIINVGKQWVFDDFFALDCFLGLGYGYSSDDTVFTRYGFSTGFNDFPIALSSGLRIGILF